jgi:hypothetical protein
MQVVAVCISRSACCSHLIQGVIALLVPQNMIVPNIEQIDEAVSSKCCKYMDLYAVNLQDILKSTNRSRANYSPGQLLLILIGNVKINVS